MSIDDRKARMRDAVFAKMVAASSQGDWVGVIALEKQVEGDLNVMYNDAVERHLRFSVGVAHQNLGQIELAIRSFQRAADISATECNYKTQGHMLMYVGMLSMGLGGEGASAKGRACFEKVRRLGEGGGYFALESEACLGLSELAKDEGRLGEAQELAANALIAADLMDDDENGRFNLQANALKSVIQNSDREAPSFDEKLMHRYREIAESIPGPRSACVVDHRSQALIFLVLNP